MNFGSYKAFDGFMRQVETVKFQAMMNTSVRDMCSSIFTVLGSKIEGSKCNGQDLGNCLADMGDCSPCS